MNENIHKKYSHFFIVALYIQILFDIIFRYLYMSLFRTHRSQNLRCETCKSDTNCSNDYLFRRLGQNTNPSITPVVSAPAPAPAPNVLTGGLLFNGSNNLTLSPGVAIGAGAYTVECWFYNNNTWTYPVGSSNRGSIIGGGPDGAASCLSVFFLNGTTITTDLYGIGTQMTYTVIQPTLNTWHHFVLVRDSNFIETVFIDGVKATSSAGGTLGTQSNGQQRNSLSYSGLSKNIGSHYQGHWQGYLSYYRINVGEALYDPTASSITKPTTQPTADSFTKYLMMGDSVTSDASTTQTVVNNGGVIRSSTQIPF